MPAFFLSENENKRVLFLELGVGMNTPGIIKYPFLKMTARNRKSAYMCVNRELLYAPKEIAERSLLLSEDIADVIGALKTDTSGMV